MLRVAGDSRVSSMMVKDLFLQPVITATLHSSRETENLAVQGTTLRQLNVYTNKPEDLFSKSMRNSARLLTSRKREMASNSPASKLQTLQLPSRDESRNKICDQSESLE